MLRKTIQKNYNLCLKLPSLKKSFAETVLIDFFFVYKE